MPVAQLRENFFFTMGSRPPLPHPVRAFALPCTRSTCTQLAHTLPALALLIVAPLHLGSCRQYGREAMDLPSARLVSAENRHKAEIVSRVTPLMISVRRSYSGKGFVDRALYVSWCQFTGMGSSLSSVAVWSQVGASRAHTL